MLRRVIELWSLITYSSSTTTYWLLLIIGGRVYYLDQVSFTITKWQSVKLLREADEIKNKEMFIYMQTIILVFVDIIITAFQLLFLFAFVRCLSVQAGFREFQSEPFIQSVECGQFILVKGTVGNSFKVAWIDRHLMGTGGHNGWNIVMMTTKMRAMVCV